MKKTIANILYPVLAIACAGVGVMDVVWGSMALCDIWRKGHEKDNTSETKETNN